jgi:hypothetical protein
MLNLESRRNAGVSFHPSRIPGKAVSGGGGQREDPLDRGQVLPRVGRDRIFLLAALAQGGAGQGECCCSEE